MLNSEPTRHHAGLRLWGDYPTLERLHAFIHRTVESSLVISEQDGFVLGLAYDVRKAFEGQRQLREHTAPNGDHHLLYGVEILWPLLLVQVGVLRHTMAFISTTRLDQAIMYELEYVVESALRTTIPAAADAVLDQLQRIGAEPCTRLEVLLDSRCRYFLERPPSERLAVLPKLLTTLDAMYPILVEGEALSTADFIPPSAFVDDEWPDFEW